MNRFYLLIPLGLLGVFAVPYVLHQRDEAETVRVQAAELERQQHTADVEKQAAEHKARTDADQRTAARVAAEKQQADAKRAQWDAETQRIATETATDHDAVTRLNAEVAGLQTQLEAARVARAKLKDEVFATAKAVEQAHLDQRTAELEVQRLTAMLARQAAGTMLPVLPTP